MIYCFDLDHTLCDTHKDEDGKWKYFEATPYPERIKVVNKLWDCLLYTSDAADEP